MNRLATVVTAFALLMVPAADAIATTFKIATITPDGTQWMTRMRAAGDDIKQRTQGRVQFKFYPGGVMGNDDAMLRKIRAGQLHGGMLSVGGLDLIYQNASILSLPLLFDSYAEVDYVRARIDPLIQQGLEKNGFVSFGLADGGFALLFASAPVRGIDDVRGRKVWVPPNDPISKSVFDTVGLAPVTLPLADVMTGLQTGMIDTVAVSPVGAIALQWYTRLKYVTDTPLLYLYGALVLEQRAFNKLTAADQAVVREVLTDVFKEFDRKNRADDADARAALKREGIEFVAVSPENQARWEAAARGARERLAKSGVFTPSVFEVLQGNLTEYRQKAKTGAR
ncbi:MAG: TRAP transporter substrate-binding protein DctP [Pseudomonadota bacterium]|nr:MAG: TRAP transporter substrate-binding protein DctP [Pseudomonadota bacterium]